jgi:phage-related protein (TIGR01555 family)
MSDETNDGGGMQNHNDGMQNVLTKLGTTKDRTHRSNTEIVQSEIIDPISLTSLYRDDHYVARVIDLMPNESTRRGFEITVDDHELQEDVRYHFKRLGLIKKLNLANKWGRLYGGGAVVLGISDGKQLSEPVDLEAVKSVDWALTLTRHELISDTIENDPAAPWGYGKPATYRLSTNVVHTTGKLNHGDVIHASRVLRFAGTQLPEQYGAENDYWGDPVAQRLIESITNIVNSDRAIGNTIQTFNQAVFKKAGLAQIMQGAGGEDKLIDMFTTMNMAQSILGMMIVDKNEEFQKIQTPVSGLAELHSVMVHAYCAAADAPATILFGTPPNGLSTDDKSGRQNWFAKVRSNQSENYVPNIEYVVELILASLDALDADASVTPNPLEELNDLEQSTIFKTYVDAAALLIDRGVLMPLEVRLSFFQSGRFSPNITLLDLPDLDGASGGNSFGKAQNEAPGDVEGDPAGDLESEGMPARSDGSQAQPLMPPSEARRQAAKGLDLRKRFKHGGSAMSLVRASHIAAGRPMTVDEIRGLKRFFDANESTKNTPPEKGRGKINWLLHGGTPARIWADSVITMIDAHRLTRTNTTTNDRDHNDANTDPHAKRSSRRKVQTEIEAGRMKPAKSFKCKVCKKAQATEYDHVSGYDGDDAKLSVEPVCASCHHKRTNKRIKDGNNE